MLSIKLSMRSFSLIFYCEVPLQPEFKGLVACKIVAPSAKKLQGTKTAHIYTLFALYYSDATQGAEHANW